MVWDVYRYLLAGVIAGMSFGFLTPAQAVAEPQPPSVPAAATLEKATPQGPTPSKQGGLFSVELKPGAASQSATSPFGFVQQNARGSSACYLVTCLDQGFDPSALVRGAPRSSQQNPYGSSSCLTLICTQKGYGVVNGRSVTSHQIITPILAIQQNPKGASMCVVGLCTHRPSLSWEGGEASLPSQQGLNPVVTLQQNSGGSSACSLLGCRDHAYKR